MFIPKLMKLSRFDKKISSIRKETKNKQKNNKNKNINKNKQKKQQKNTQQTK
jgi:hypothetical protein